VGGSPQVRSLPDALILHLFDRVSKRVSLCAAAISITQALFHRRLDSSRQIAIFLFGFGARRQGRLSSGSNSAVAMTKDEERELREQLARLQQEHRDLDVAISALQHSPGSDLLQVQRLKKRKLVLRDRIAFIEDELTPDIIA
jgi:hypothetical protein